MRILNATWHLHFVSSNKRTLFSSKYDEWNVYVKYKEWYFPLITQHRFAQVRGFILTALPRLYEDL